jgi:hypothetical protein
VDGWRKALVAGAFAYTLLYASTVDVLMIRDSRYAVERWLYAHVGPEQLVGTAFPDTVTPRFRDFKSKDIGNIEDLQQYVPAYYVLNADYARAVPKDTPLGRFVTQLQQQTLGYRLVLRERTPAPWPWLPGAHHDLVGPRLETFSLSTLRSVNPTIEVYARVPPE